MIPRSLTSPSNLLRRQKCPGSARMEHGLPEEPTPDSEEGRLLHAACATENLDGLQGEQRDSVEHALRLRDEAMETVFGTALPDDCEFAVEKPLAFGTVRRGEFFRGTADFVAIGEKRALIVDYKFGRLPVEPAADNLQLAAYAAMLTHSERFTGTVFVALVRPRAPGGQSLTMADYTHAEILDAAHVIRGIYDASNRLDARLAPSEDACRYCRAKLSCPALSASVHALAITPRETLLTLPSARLGATMDAIRFAAQIKPEVSAEITRRIGAGEMPGWKLRQNGATSEVADTRAAFVAFRTAFATHERYQGEGAPTPADDFLRCVSVQLTPLVNLVQALTGSNTAKARMQVEAVLGCGLTRTAKLPSPVRT
jgi:hypothetical protein